MFGAEERKNDLRGSFTDKSPGASEKRKETIGPQLLLENENTLRGEMWGRGLTSNIPKTHRRVSQETEG